MKTRREISITGEYSMDASGGMAKTTSMLPSVILAIRTTKGSSLVAPTFGRRRRAATIRPATPRELEADFVDALEHLTTRGLIWDLRVSAARNPNNGIVVTVEFKDPSGNQKVIF